MVCHFISPVETPSATGARIFRRSIFAQMSISVRLTCEGLVTTASRTSKTLALCNHLCTSGYLTWTMLVHMDLLYQALLCMDLLYMNFQLMNRWHNEITEGVKTMVQRKLPSSLVYTGIQFRATGAIHSCTFLDQSQVLEYCDPQ